MDTCSGWLPPDNLARGISVPEKKDIVLLPNRHNLCVTPYELHPKGCPNFNKKKGCPPNSVEFFEFFDETKPIFIVWSVFDLGAHVQKMRRQHPEWSERQLYCCLYWQGRARRFLRDTIEEYQTQFPLLGETLSIRPDSRGAVSTCPEAMGLNVTATMRNLGEILEWPVKTKVYHVAVIGSLLNLR